MQVSKAAEQSQDSLRQDSKRQYNQLDNRYGKIGISAVAAALRYQGGRRTTSEYRIPFDRD